jgi:hypothetical protein
MFIAILTSIKLYLHLDTTINESGSLSQSFYLLSINIYKILELSEENRKCEGNQYLNEVYSEYIKLLDSSNLFKRDIKNDSMIMDIKGLKELHGVHGLISKISNTSSDSGGSNPFSESEFKETV